MASDANSDGSIGGHSLACCPLMLRSVFRFPYFFLTDFTKPFNKGTDSDVSLCVGSGREISGYSFEKTIFCDKFKILTTWSSEGLSGWVPAG
jgi:hypothetical protein